MSAVPWGVLPSAHFNSFPLLSLAKAAGPAESAPAHHTHHQASHDEANPSPNAHQAHNVPHCVRCPAEACALPEMQGLHAGRVWHVPLLQGHEEVWRTWSYEAVLHPPAVLSGELWYNPIHPRLLQSSNSSVWLTMVRERRDWSRLVSAGRIGFFSIVWVAR